MLFYHSLPLRAFLPLLTCGPLLCQKEAHPTTSPLNPNSSSLVSALHHKRTAMEIENPDLYDYVTIDLSATINKFAGLLLPWWELGTSMFRVPARARVHLHWTERQAPEPCWLSLFWAWDYLPSCYVSISSLQNHWVTVERLMSNNLSDSRTDVFPSTSLDGQKLKRAQLIFSTRNLQQDPIALDIRWLISPVPNALTVFEIRSDSEMEEMLTRCYRELIIFLSCLVLSRNVILRRILIIDFSQIIHYYL